MKHKALRGRYRYLSPIERMALVLESVNRDDDGELGALLGTCSIKMYRMQDPVFWQLHDQSKKIAYLFTIHWLFIKREVEAARANQAKLYLLGSGYEKGFDMALNACGSVPSAKHPVWQTLEDTLKPHEERIDKAKEAERLCGAQLKGLHAGFLRFCQMAQLEPHQLLAWTPPLWAEVTGFLETLCPDIEADEETAQTTCERLSSLWPGFQKGNPDQHV